MNDIFLPKGRASKKKPIYCIQGEYVTSAQIAARLHIGESQVHTRMRKLRDKPGAITWQALKGSKE
jgi:biotin operon repressor